MLVLTVNSLLNDNIRVNLDTFLRFIILHNETIILLTIGFICLLSVYVVFRQVFGLKSTSADDSADFSKIEESLKRLLNQTNVALQNVSDDAKAGGSSGTVVGGGATSREALALKKELEERAAVIEALKKQVEEAQSGDNAFAELRAKIKNLEGKLAEYEIIEDDIADLSHYKEENARLKTELEHLKRGGPALVDQFANAMNGGSAAANSNAENSTTTAASTPKEPTPAMTMDQMVEAVQAQVTAKVVDDKSKVGETLDFSAPAPAVVTTPTSAAAQTVEPSPEAMPKSAETSAKGDIFAEFSGTEAEGADPLAQLGEIDTNRMLEELKDLNGDLQAGADALEEPSDLDKMSAEAEKLAKSGS